MPNTIDIFPLRREQNFAQAWAEWDGFVTVAAGEMSLPPILRLVEGSIRNPAEFARAHAAVGLIAPLGCQFLRDVTFTGMLYPFLGDRLVDDGSHLAKVSLDWIGKFPRHRPGCQDDRPPRVLHGPVMSAVGPGHQTFGHWIIDFLPRLAVARDVLGPRFAELRFLLMTDTPGWARSLLQRFFGIDEHRIIDFELGRDEFQCERVCYPTFAHSYPFNIHSYIKRLYRQIAAPQSGHRRICIQRRSSMSGRRFERQAEFERLAVEEGYELIDPQALPFDEQIALFSSARVVIGEYGSALHNSVWSADATAFGILNAPGIEQTRLCAAFGQAITYVVGDAVDDRWTLSDAQLAAFFRTMRGDAAGPGHRESGDPEPLASAVTRQRWRLSGADGQPVCPAFRLTTDGAVDGLDWSDARSWGVSGDALVLFDPLSQPVARFAGRIAVGAGIVLLERLPTGEFGPLFLETIAPDDGPRIEAGARWPAEAVAGSLEGTADARVVVGRFCVIGDRVRLLPGRPTYRQVSRFPFDAPPGSATHTQPKPMSGGADPVTTIGHDVHIEADVAIESGVCIGDGAVILSHSVVRTDIEPYAVAAGNPAVTLSKRLGEDQIRRLRAVRWWDWPSARLREWSALLGSDDVEAFLSTVERE